MVVCKDNLGLSLSLSSTNHHIINNNNNHKIIINNDIIVPPPQTTSSSPLQLNLMISPFHSSSTSSTPLDRSLDTCRSHLRGIDVNKSTTHGGGVEEDAGVSSPKSTVSTVSGKRSSGERDSGDEAERATSHGIISDEEDGGENSRKKLRLSKEQSATLEESFKEHTTLNPKQKQALAKRLGLRPRQVEVWFQNRRARTKLKQTEVDCEFLKGCYEKLTEENRRLQKEVHELRALKLSPQFYMHMTPPTTLTMCPSCERVAGPTPRPRPVNLWGGSLFSARPVDSPHLRL